MEPAVSVARNFGGMNLTIAKSQLMFFLGVNTSYNISVHNLYRKVIGILLKTRTVIQLYKNVFGFIKFLYQFLFTKDK